MILDNISVNVNKGEFFFLLGPSGCGKTTLLRTIAGLVSHETGNITLNGKLIQKLPAHKRDVNTVFQNYALFPHMNVRDNVGFGLKMKKKSTSEIGETVDEMLHLVGLDAFHNRFPAQLSGGQMQRVALARALANKPSLLLLDEPLGALDVKLRKQMQNELRRIQQEVGITFICVTHDQEEALSVGDRIGVMSNGKLEQVGKAEELYNDPVSKFVCDFLGESNFIEIEHADRSTGFTTVLTKSTPIKIRSSRIHVEKPNFVGIRPEHISLSESGISMQQDNNWIRAIVTDLRFSGPFFEVFTVTEWGLPIVSRIPSAHSAPSIQRGKEVYLTWQPEHVILLN
jgi:spermidine/putrescine transport system ATP-binding protein